MPDIGTERLARRQDATEAPAMFTADQVKELARQAALDAVASLQAQAPAVRGTLADTAPPPPLPPTIFPTEPIVDEQTREPMTGLHQRLSAEKRPGYQRYWMNDIPGRRDQFLRAGWTHVVDKDGRPVHLPVGKSSRGGAEIAYLMEIPQAWYDKDSLKNLERANEIVAQMKRQDRDKVQNGYIPAQGQTIRTGR